MRSIQGDVYPLDYPLLLQALDMSLFRRDRSIESSFVVSIERDKYHVFHGVSAFLVKEDVSFHDHINDSSQRLFEQPEFIDSTS